MVNCNIQYLTVKPRDIFELSQDLSEQCHIRFRVSPDASAYLGTVGAGSGVTQRLTDVPSPVINSGEMKPLAMFGAQANNNATPATVATEDYGYQVLWPVGAFP